jgi:uncharacterized protein (DUF2164 family)
MILPNDREKIVVFEITCFQASDQFAKIVELMGDVYYQGILIKRKNLIPGDQGYKKHQALAHEQLSDMEKSIYSPDQAKLV